MWKFSEFCGVPLDEQRDKIRQGLAVMREHGIKPRYFFAPGHTFDENTLTALKEESDIRIVSDTIALKPYRHGDFVFIPQFSGQCRKMKLSGVYTFCYHPNTMGDKSFEELESFLREHKDHFVSFDELDLMHLKDKSLFDKMLSWTYFTYRKIKGLR